jgi:RHS repeat-associated protein
MPAGCSADPVDDATGQLSESMTDVSLPGPGGGWSFTRSYYSGATGTSSILGPGWKVAMNANLSIDPISGNVTFNDEYGSSIPYTSSGSGSYLAGEPGITSTLHENMDGSFTVTRQDGYTYNFSSTGVWTSFCDRNDNCTSYTRNTDGNVTSLTDPAGRTITFTYTGSGSTARLEYINLPGSHTVSYTYDTNGNLASVTNIEGDETQYTYDSSHRITYKYDGNDNVVYHNVYGTDGRISSQTNGLGYETDFAWDSANQIETTTDARGKLWKSYYAGGILEKRVDPLGNTTSYTYSSQLLPTKIVPPTGHAVTMTYDSSGNMLTRTNVDASTTETWTYNSLNEPLTYQNGRGKTTIYEYDTAGNLLRVIDPLNRAVDYTYNDQGQVLTSTSGETYNSGTDTVSGGKATTNTYTDGTGGSNLGDLASVTQPPQTGGAAGPETTYTYDAIGRPLTVVSPRGNLSGATASDFRTTTAYDDSADTTTVTDPLGNHTVTKLDHAGNKLSVQSFDSGTDLVAATEWVYDAGDRLEYVCPKYESNCSTTTDPKTSYGYDHVGNMTSRTDPNNKTTSYAYDDANEPLSTTTPSGHVTSHTYTGGRLATITDALGNATLTPTTDGMTTLGYDDYGNLSSRTYSDSGTPNSSYVFDAAGNRTSMTDGRGTTKYAYDDANQLIDVCPTNPANCATTTDAKTAYTYDAFGQVTERSYPDGDVADYTYYPDGELETVAEGGLTATFDYDADGELTEIDHGNGLVETRAYDDAGRLTQIQTKSGSTVVFQEDYTLDALGRPIKTIRSGDQDITWSYSYDSQGRLTDACREAETDCRGSSDPKFSYSYDANGNRTSMTDLAGHSTSYAYDTGGENELTTVTHPDLSTTSYTYDADGRMTAEGSRTYTYNEASQLTGMSTSGVTGSVSFTYDGDGNRLTQNDTRAGGSDKAYTWDVNGSTPELESEHDVSTGDLIRSYTRNGSMPLWMQTPNGSGTTTYDYQTDSLGSVVDLTDASGDQACSYAYGPYGDADASADGAGTECVTGVSPSVNPVEYTGEYQDATGLYDLRAREYDPALGQMLTTDPIDHPGQSPYQYANDGPTWLVDPTGMSARGGAPWYEPWKYLRAPDYVVLDAGMCPPELILCTDIPITITSSGHVYVGLGSGAGVPGELVALRLGWINQGKRPTERQVDSFVHGFSVTGSGYLPLGDIPAGPSGAETWGQMHELPSHSGATATELGAGAGEGKSLSLIVSDNWRMPINVPGWR